MPINQGRVDRVVAAAERIAFKLEANPRGPKATGYKKRLEEYRVSLERMHNGIPEHHTVDNPRRTVVGGWGKMFKALIPNSKGVDIPVPLDKLSIKD